MAKSNKKSTRVLQVNLDGSGGAFSLMIQFQKLLFPDYKFDYYWMGNFKKQGNENFFAEMDSHIYEENLRHNRLLGHILLPFRFYNFLKQNTYQIIHINADTAYKHLLYAIPAKIANVPVIIIHSHSSGVNGDHQQIKKFMHKLCKPFIRKVGTIFLTCSNLASAWMFNGFQNEAILIKNGVDLDKFRFSLKLREKYRLRLGIQDKILIGTVGNLSYQKYPEYLIDILDNLEPKYQLIFIGDGPHRSEVEKYANNKNLNNRVIFYGNTTHVCEILNALDVFVMTSRFEGLPVSAVEAQANGLPCILSDKVTKETKILDTCQFASISDNASSWADMIKKIHINSDRRYATVVLKKKGFDIKDSSRILKAVYDSAASKV